MAFLAAGNMSAQLAFTPPEGGWDYLYDGAEAAFAADGEGFASLDGTWSHDNGSDQWDGSGIGGDFGDENRPGGAQVITEGETTYLRIQDTGDPRDYGFSDPMSNRKVYFGHDLTEDGASETQLDDGVTLIFRARVPVDGPLDVLHPDGQQDNGTRPYPENGDGYVTSDGGKGNFVIKQAGGGAIAFSLTTATDTPGGDPNNGVTNFAGLSMNEFAGNAISGDVNFGQGDGQNVVAFDPTAWHEFWITIESDPLGEGTHIASIYLDGAIEPSVFKMTAGPGDDFGGISYLAMGATATPQNAALDIDFFGVKMGAVRPAAKGFAAPAGGWNYAYEGNEATYAADGEGFASLDGTWSHDNGSDQWDGSGIGGDFGDENRPGGAQIITEGSTEYLRIQDTGDPRDFGFSDPASNRKVYLGHNLTEDGASDTVMDEGVTLNFRARVPTSGPLDVLHPDGQGDAGTRPYPENGDGYVTSDGGKGNFVIKQNAGGAIAFSLTTATDTPGGNPNEGVTNFAGLSMNEFAGNAITGDVNFGQGDGQNVVPFDPTAWHEFWITIQADPEGVGTHLASIYIDGNTTPQVFKMTAGPGDDFGGISYLAMGATATPQNAALDIDFFRVKFEAVAPEGASNDPPPNFGNLSPALGSSFVNAGDGLSFTATSEVGIPRENIAVVLNGVDYTADLDITGNENSWTVSLGSLQENLVYVGELVVTDANGVSIPGILSFNTFASNNLTIEAEDFNFDNGEFINNPGVSGGDSFFDKGGNTDSQGVDFNELSAEFDFDGNPDAWRYPLVGNMPNTVVNNNEADRARYADAPDLDFSVNGTEPGEWLNYTRDFGVGEANVYLRAQDGNTYVVQLDRVSGSTGANQTLEPLGQFNGSGGGYDWVALTDASGQLAAIDLSGEVTLRATIVSGSPDLNFFMVTPAVEVILPELPPAPVSLVASSSEALSEPTVVDFGALTDNASYEFYFTAVKDGASTAIAGNNEFAIKLDQWNEQGLFGTTAFGVADNLFTAVDGQSAESVFDRPVHVIVVSDAGAGESRLFVDGTHVGTWAGTFALAGDTKVMGARLEQETDHMGAGSVMHSWATYDGALSAEEVAEIYGNLPPLPVEPTLSIVNNGDGTVTVTFTGVLQAAAEVGGPYTDVAADSPLTIPADQAAQFARARQP